MARAWLRFTQPAKLSRSSLSGVRSGMKPEDRLDVVLT